MNTARLNNIRQSKGYHILGVKPGQQLEIHEKVGQGSNERIWRFKGLVLKVRKPNHPDGTFTIRGKVAGMTIEKIYPLSFNKFEKVLVLDEYKIRRAKLYYLRDKVGKGARLKSIATAEGKGRDLLAEAKSLAEEQHTAYIAATQPADATPAEAPVSETTEETTETPVVEDQTEGTPAETAPEAVTEEAQEAPAPEAQEEQAEQPVEAASEEAEAEQPVDQASEEEKQ